MRNIVFFVVFLLAVSTLIGAFAGNPTESTQVTTAALSQETTQIQ